jgi:hypothetical protein
MLMLNESPSIDSSQFLDSCSDFISPEDFEILTNLSISPNDISSPIPEWSIWETLLRNRLVHQRGSAGSGYEKYLHEERDSFSEIEKGVQEAYLKSDPLEREDFLDQMRWTKLEDLEVGHDFDFIKLCIYKMKLMLCEKRLGRNKEKGSLNYDDIVETIYGVNPLDPPQIEEHKGI